MGFAPALLAWYRQCGRHDLPWQENPTPYRVWVSEIMLQQTQVVTVVAYYHRFIKAFPSLDSLATADLDRVLFYWSGLGYYARARNLHKAAVIICENYNGQFPDTVDSLIKLPGIGRSTAGAILSFGMRKFAVILDGNVKRVLSRFYALKGRLGQADSDRQLWQLAAEQTPDENVHDYNQAIMDLGATVCTRSQPKCSVCPLSVQCRAHALHAEMDFPVPKRSKKKPNQQICLLMLKRNDGAVLLEKRPPTGVWGGLWSFPGCGLNEDLGLYCRQYFISAVENTSYWKSVLHEFSHFSLKMYPVLLKVTVADRAIMDSNALNWYQPGTPLPGGVAAPIQNLLKQHEVSDVSHSLLQEVKSTS